MLSNISKSLPNNPLKILFIAHIQDQDCESLATKTALIQRFQHELEELECNSENQTTHLYAVSIFSGFSGCLSLAGMSLLNPLLAVAVGFTAVGSAATVIAGACLHNQKLSQQIPKLKRYALALGSSSSKDWATLWYIAGTDLFLESMTSASKGNINHKGELIRNDGKNPLAVAVDYCAERLGITRTELLDRAKNLNTTVTPILNQSAPTVLQTQTNAVTVLQSNTPQAVIETTDNWIKGFLSSTCLVWGNQGSGKSWFVRLLALRKKAAGYRVIVFDPNSNKSEWKGVELYNTYEDIEAKMQWYVDEVESRYRRFGKSEISESEWRKQLWDNGQAITVICEEMTTYADFITDKELLTKFVKVAATLSRKQELPCVFITHNNTQSCLGEIKGLANLISRMQQIQLLPTTDPITSQPVASGEALIKLDGSETWTRITTPKVGEKITNFGEEISSDRQKLEDILKLPSSSREQDSEPPSSDPREPLNQPSDKGCSGSVHDTVHGSEPDGSGRFTPLNLSKEQFMNLNRVLSQTMNQTQIIEHLWSVKKGGSDAWKAAHTEYKSLITE
ncbi:hypothetical protein H6G91_17150 [Nostoc muscorum FACHB-395]|nr:hypothetical protein [Desmonostoc muscorum FACHB-395]